MLQSLTSKLQSLFWCDMELEVVAQGVLFKEQRTSQVINKIYWLTSCFLFP